MDPELKNELLSNREVIDEINRHLWIESEKAGRDVGFETAAEDWIKRFSTAWMQYNMPQKLQSAKESNQPSVISQVAKIIKRRRAKSYVVK